MGGVRFGREWLNKKIAAGAKRQLRDVLGGMVKMFNFARNHSRHVNYPELFCIFCGPC